MFFMLRYPPVRPTFPGDATPEENEIMKTHIEYWTDLMNQGYSHVFGPVADPQGWYGLGIVEVENEEQLRGFIQRDPAIQAGLMKPEFYPMHAVVPKK